MNLNKSTTDVHDYAHFANISSLKQLNIFSTYPLYHIKDFSLSVTSSSTLTPPSSQEKRLNSECVNNNNSFVNLNKWFESILDFLHLLNHSPTHAQQQTTTVESKIPKVDACSSSSCACVTQLKNRTECILEQIDISMLLKSYLIKFFLESLGGNFFKLKNLISFLNESITILTNELNQSKNDNLTTTKNGTSSLLPTYVVDFESTNSHLDNSIKPLTILNEIHTFLTLTCTFNLFKVAVKKHNKSSAKNHLILNDINGNSITSKEITSSINDSSISLSNKV